MTHDTKNQENLNFSEKKINRHQHQDDADVEISHKDFKAAMIKML